MLRTACLNLKWIRRNKYKHQQTTSRFGRREWCVLVLRVNIKLTDLCLSGNFTFGRLMRKVSLLTPALFSFYETKVQYWNGYITLQYMQWNIIVSITVKCLFSFGGGGGVLVCVCGGGGGVGGGGVLFLFVFCCGFFFFGGGCSLFTFWYRDRYTRLHIYVHTFMRTC